MGFSHLFLLTVLPSLVFMALKPVKLENLEVANDAGSHYIDDSKSVLEPLGCFADDPEDRLLNTLLLTYRDTSSTVFSGTLINWLHYGEFLKRMIQECYKAAAAQKFAYLGIQFYGECWVGQKMTTKKAQHSATCIKQGFKVCRTGETSCAGTGNSIFIYKIAQSCPAGLKRRPVCLNSLPPSCSHQPTISNSCPLEYGCACPQEKPFYQLGKCYAAFECPMVQEDGLSDTNTGHNFVLSSPFSDDGLAYGMHISAFKLSPHWYHAIVLLKADNNCIQASQKISIAENSQFMVVRYNQEPVKIVDFVERKGKLGFKGLLSIGIPSPFKAIAECQLKIVRVLDLRRYNLKDPQFPSRQTYLMFGGNGKTFLSHIPSRCKDFQELLELRRRPHYIRKDMLEQGLLITFPELRGEPDDTDGGITSYLKEGGKYRFATNREKKAWKKSSTLHIKKRIALDSTIFNILCT